MVVVVGAGASGLGVAWDLLLRGIAVTVVESQEIGRGTSGRFHGLLHSGGRYVVTDPAAARQCALENVILRRIAPGAIERTGGYFVSFDDDGDDYVGPWLQGARSTGVMTRSVDINRLRTQIPELSPLARQAYAVEDSVLEGFELLEMLRQNIERAGGTVLTHTRLEGVHQQGGRVAGISVRVGQEKREVACDALISAAGPWGGQIAHRFFEDDVDMHLAAGMMLIFANRRVPQIVNRMGTPGDGDILVPHGETVILGTTNVLQEDPDSPIQTNEQPRYLLTQGEKMFPRMGEWRVLRAFSGVRPLFGQSVGVGGPDRFSRDFTVLDHGARGGLKGAFSLVGGKWTTFRLMAEKASDAVAAFLNISARSTTATTPLEPIAAVTKGQGPLVCECENIGLDALQKEAAESIDAWRTKTWFAMGPCQGTICGHRGAMIRAQSVGAPEALTEFLDLREERDRGLGKVAWGANARQLLLNHAIRYQTLAEGLLNHAKFQ